MAIAALGPLLTSLGGLSTALSVGSAVVGTIGAINQANFQSQVANNNAAIAEDNARRAVFESQVEAQETDFAARDELGQLLAQQGASGLSLGSGSFALRRKGQEELAAKDRGFIRNQGEVQATRFRQQANDQRAEAAQAKAAGRNALISGAFEVGTSLVSGATRVNARKARSLVA